MSREFAGLAMTDMMGRCGGAGGMMGGGTMDGMGDMVRGMMGGGHDGARPG